MDRNVQMLEAILQRLNVLVALQLDSAPEAATGSITKRIHRLTELGLSPSEIGSILGKKANYVSAVIGGGRKRSNA